MYPDDYVLILVPGSFLVTVPFDLLTLTEDVAPLIYLEDEHLKGIPVDIIESAFRHRGSDITSNFLFCRGRRVMKPR